MFVFLLASERQRGHVTLLRQQGMSPGAYHWANYVVFLALYMAFMAVFVGFGAAIGLNVFTRTAPSVQVGSVPRPCHACVVGRFSLLEHPARTLKVP